MLKDNFFTIKDKKDIETGRDYRLALNGLHPIFQAHFAGSPVMPGACVAQMIKELTSDYTGKDLFIANVRNNKFFVGINPVEYPEIDVRITLSKPKQEDGFPAVSAVISHGDTVLSKALMSFKTTPLLQEQMRRLRICVIVPAYNNEKTVAAVLNDIMQYTDYLIVVNDGSTDKTTEIVESFEHKIDVLSYRENRGKGYALNEGLDIAEMMGFRYAITMDSDGQHFASEIVKFVDCVEKYPDAFLIGQRTTKGDMPAKNSFANKFSNFWFTVQTARCLRDTQNGFRLYPITKMKGMRSYSCRYEAELEILVRSAWRGIRIASVPTLVYYPPDDERVTHFRPGLDFLRISVMNTVLTFLAIVYGYPSMLYRLLFTGKK
ncbi:MAG: glycosyltransferase [Tannerella sp.]|jgi:3-hydroxymyristoyl/3-hydroxydecanoyl-(acyl carrier protein) dehydratase|nr:glycosyltransferase [Tannerella sp.]